MRFFLYYEPNQRLANFRELLKNKIELPDDYQDIVNAVKANGQYVSELSKNIDSMSMVGKVRSNQTGTRVTMKLRIGDETYSVSVYPTQHPNDGPRTVPMIIEEIAICLLSKVKILDSKKYLFDKIREDASGVDAGQWQAYVSSYDVETIITHSILSSIDHDSPLFRKITEDVNVCVASGAVMNKANKHAAKKAMKALEEVVLKAFNSGASIDDVNELVKKCLVKSVIQN